jgi:non-ribosomal peptide synthetase component E (peptide arylation enzyme)
MVKDLPREIGSLEHIFITGERVPEGTISIDRMLQDEIEKRNPGDWLERTKCKAMEFSTITTTTGTTGFPKFVERAICSYTDMCLAFAERWKVTNKDVFAVFSPSASGPNVAGYYVAPLAKARVAMLERFNNEAALKLIEKEKITIIPVVPTMLIKMIGHPKFSSFDLSSLRLIISIGASLPYQTAMDAERLMGAPIVQRYGSVDSGLSSTHSPEESQEVRFRTVGRPVGSADVKLLDDNGDPVKDGEAGEVVVRVKREFSGYFNDLKATLASWKGDGWYKMGDLGKWDPQGNLMIVGRKKEMIIRGGQNIYPFEIEELMLGHNKVGEIAIIGIPDKTMGERACACIVPESQDDLITLDEMVAYLKEKDVSAYKLPERLAFIEQMPMVAGGQKVDKKTLKENIVEKLTEEGVIEKQ